MTKINSNWHTLLGSPFTSKVWSLFFVLQNLPAVRGEETGVTESRRHASQGSQNHIFGPFLTSLVCLVLLFIDLLTKYWYGIYIFFLQEKKLLHFGLEMTHVKLVHFALEPPHLQLEQCQVSDGRISRWTSNLYKGYITAKQMGIKLVKPFTQSFYAKMRKVQAYLCIWNSSMLIFLWLYFVLFWWVEKEEFLCPSGAIAWK